MKMIVCTDKDWAIGYRGELIYYIPEDMKRFKSLTMGDTVIMGVNTFKSIGKPLPGRNNIVLTQPNRHAQDLIDMTRTFENDRKKSRIDNTTLQFKWMADLLRSPEILKSSDTYLIGGALTYQLLMYYCDTLEITMVFPHEDIVNGCEAVITPPADAFLKGFEFCGKMGYYNRMPIIERGTILRYTDMGSNLGVGDTIPFTRTYELTDMSGMLVSPKVDTYNEYVFLTFKEKETKLLP